MTLAIGKKRLTINDVQNVARNNKEVELTEDAKERINFCRAFVDKRIVAKEIMYGINTGIGELANVALPPEKLEEFQKYLVYSHAAGIGDPFSIDFTRAAMLSRISVLSHGNSACRLLVPETMMAMLNKGVTPVVCEKGSVGACGDLSPMSQIALVMIGEGEAFYQNERMSAKKAMEKAGVPIMEFAARDGLSCINGSNYISGAGSLVLCDAINYIKNAEIAAAMTLEALNANVKAFDERVHKIRGYTGAIKTAAHLRAIMAESEVLRRDGKKVQDAYAMRSTPQVVGALWDALYYTIQQFEIELNGVGDNPIFFPDDETVLTGANFQGTPMSYPLDFVGAGITMVGVISERRLNRLMNVALSAGLPAYLTKGAGMFSGLMLTQYTAGALLCESRILSTPASIGSIPAAADQEDFVSMGMTTLLKTRDIIKNCNAVLGIEMMAAAQALDFLNDRKPGVGSRAAHQVIRKHVDFLDEDRPTYPDNNKMAELVTSGEIVKAVEAAVGKLD